MRNSAPYSSFLSSHARGKRPDVEAFHALKVPGVCCHDRKVMAECGGCNLAIGITNRCALPFQVSPQPAVHTSTCEIKTKYSERWQHSVLYPLQPLLRRVRAVCSDVEFCNDQDARVLLVTGQRP